MKDAPDFGTSEHHGFYPNSTYGWDSRPERKSQSSTRCERDEPKMADGKGQIFHDVREVENHLAKLQLNF